MKLPQKKVISEKKLREYLLTPRIEDDKAGFLTLAGYSLENWRVLEEDLPRLVEEEEALLIRTTQYGEIYHVKGQSIGPNDQILYVITVWIQLYATGETRFVTLVPDKEARQ